VGEGTVAGEGEIWEWGEIWKIWKVRLTEPGFKPFLLLFLKKKI
jgi:hypothetical protein